MTVQILPTFLLIGNSGQKSDEKNAQPAVECAEEQISDHSKTVYINDSFNLDSIPFDIENIIDEDNTEDSD